MLAPPVSSLLGAAQSVPRNPAQAQLTGNLGVQVCLLLGLKLFGSPVSSQPDGVTGKQGEDWAIPIGLESLGPSARGEG